MRTRFDESSQPLTQLDSRADPIGVLRAVFVHGQHEELVCLIGLDAGVPHDVLLHIDWVPAKVRLKKAAGGQTHPDQNIVPLLEPEGTSLGDEAGVVCLRHRRSQQRKRHHGAADPSHKPSHCGFPVLSGFT